MPEFGEEAEIVNELALETAQVGVGDVSVPQWHQQVAISTLIMALITAVGALLAGMTAHETLLDRTEELIEISRAENEKVSVEVLKAKIEIISELGGTPDPMDVALVQAYDDEINLLEEEAASNESRIRSISSTHLQLAVAVTLLSVGITISGMSVIVRQKYLWYIGLVFGFLGSIGVVYSIFDLFV